MATAPVDSPASVTTASNPGSAGVADPFQGVSSVFGGKVPDITPAQIVAVIANVIAVAVAFGVHIAKEQQIAILALAGALGSILVLSDSHLRSQRAHAAVLKHAVDHGVAVDITKKP